MSYGRPDDHDLPADPWADEEMPSEDETPDEDETPPEAGDGAAEGPRAFEQLPPPEPDPAVVADLQAIAEIERDLQGVDAALRRLDDGTYGACVACGRPIEAATLEANPIEDHCAHCDPAQGRLTGL